MKEIGSSYYKELQSRVEDESWLLYQTANGVCDCQTDKQTRSQFGYEGLRSTFYRQNHQNVQQNRERAGDAVDDDVNDLNNLNQNSQLLLPNNVRNLAVKVELETFAIIMITEARLLDAHEI